MQSGVAFARVMEEYGSLEAEVTHSNTEEDPNRPSGSPEKSVSTAVQASAIQTEERLTGSVSWSTYAKYLRYAGGISWAPFILILLILGQGCQGKYAPISH